MNSLPGQAGWITPQHLAMMRALGLDAEGLFTSPLVQVWRTLPDRENATLNWTAPDGQTQRLHIKRYPRAQQKTFRAELNGQRLLQQHGIPTAKLAGHVQLRDGRSAVMFQDLAGYEPADKAIEAGLEFARILEPTADLAALLHNRRLHHQDLYLCHFMVRSGTEKASIATVDQAPATGTLSISGDDVRLIDVARVRRFGFLNARRSIIKDLAQFWFSTLPLPITDQQRQLWLNRYAERRGKTPRQFLPAILAKCRRIARHDAELRKAQPTRNISIPSLGQIPTRKNP